MRVILLGGGYVAERLRRTLDDEVICGQRSSNPNSRNLDLGALPIPWPELRGARVLITAPPGPPGRETQVAAWLTGARHVIYVSSTGVYGSADGAWVDETASVAPIGDAGVGRARAERELTHGLAAASVPLCVLRLAGIYGPGRSLSARARAATPVVGDGTSFVSRIHVDDVVTIISAAMQQALIGTYNVADDEPSRAGEVADGVAAALGLPPPPRVDAQLASPAARAMLLANRRISTARIKAALGLTLRYPSWRHGLAAELAEAADYVNVTPMGA